MTIPILRLVTPLGKGLEVIIFKKEKKNKEKPQVLELQISIFRHELKQNILALL